VRTGDAVVPAPSTLVDDSLRRLCEQLAARHFSVTIDVHVVCGEPDVRLRVCRPQDPAVTVELLGPDPTSWSSRGWHAVRLQHGDRRLWHGPDHGCPLEEVATFVAALVCAGTEHLGQRYVDLG
jgi:hypothetical protein